MDEHLSVTINTSVELVIRVYCLIHANFMGYDERWLRLASNLVLDQLYETH